MTVRNLSPGLERTGRACAWIEREDGFVLMTEARAGWTLPGGGIEPGETPQQAALREAWEEVGAHGEVLGESWVLDHGAGSVCVPMRLSKLEASPEGRRLMWVNPHALPWADDFQLRQILAARGQTPAHLAVPPLVAQARAAARDAGFTDACTEETGRLLRTLAATRPAGRLLELGTGLGVGAAWLQAGMTGGARLLTVEHDPQRAEAATQVFSGCEAVQVQASDWADALKHGPFDLIFNDCGPAKDPAQLDRLVDALNPGGLLVTGNVSPPMYISEPHAAGDGLRDALFSYPQLTCSEVQVSRRERVILATRGPR